MNGKVEESVGEEEEGVENDETSKTEEGMEEDKHVNGKVEEEEQTNNGINYESEDSLDRDQAQIIIGGEGMKEIYTKVKEHKRS